MNIEFNETNPSEPVVYPEAPLYDGEERSPYLPVEDPNAPEATVSGEFSDVEPLKAIEPTKPDQNQVEVAAPVNIWDAIDRDRSDETRKGYSAPAAKMSSTAIQNAFTSFDNK